MCTVVWYLSDTKATSKMFYAAKNDIDDISLSSNAGGVKFGLQGVLSGETFLFWEELICALLCHDAIPFGWSTIISQNRVRNARVNQTNLVYDLSTCKSNLAKHPCLFINDFYKSIVDYMLEDTIMNFAMIVSLTIKAVRNVCPFSSSFWIFNLRQSLVRFGVTFNFLCSVMEVWKH